MAVDILRTARVGRLEQKHRRHHMKRRIVLALLLGVGTLCLSVVGAQESTKVIEVEQLRDNLFVLRGEGGGGNVAVFVTTGGVVVVDSKNPFFEPPKPNPECHFQKILPDGT